MPEFVCNDRAEDDSDQRQHSMGSGRRIALHGRLGHPHEAQQKYESKVDADFDSEEPANRDGPISHMKSSVVSPRSSAGKSHLAGDLGPEHSQLFYIVRFICVSYRCVFVMTEGQRL